VKFILCKVSFLKLHVLLHNLHFSIPDLPCNWDFGFYKSVLTNECECGVFFTKTDSYCECPFSEGRKFDLECHKDGCTLDNIYLNEVQKNFDPAKKDEVIAQLISHYGWGNGDSLIQNLTTTFVNLLVQYPSCVPGSSASSNQPCSEDQFRTILSFSKGILEYRCNVGRPSEALSSETPPSENPPSEAPSGKALTMRLAIS
jgi:hypothetical protein